MSPEIALAPERWPELSIKALSRTLREVLFTTMRSMAAEIHRCVTMPRPDRILGTQLLARSSRVGWAMEKSMKNIVVGTLMERSIADHEDIS